MKNSLSQIDLIMRKIGKGKVANFPQQTKPWVASDVSKKKVVKVK